MRTLDTVAALVEGRKVGKNKEDPRHERPFDVESKIALYFDVRESLERG
jgi:hypothetical protein